MFFVVLERLYSQFTANLDLAIIWLSVAAKFTWGLIKNTCEAYSLPAFDRFDF